MTSAAVHAAPAGKAAWRCVHVVQGEHHVTADFDVMLTTILGSCVAACLRDPLAGVGGMNHFLLPGDGEHEAHSDAIFHGVHAMELLVNGLLQKGARRERLQAKLFGGARMLRGLTDVGESNARFAEDFLAREGVRVVGGSIGGERGRRVQFWPVSGRARQMLLAGQDAIFEAESCERPRALPVSGVLELF